MIPHVARRSYFLDKLLHYKDLWSKNKEWRVFLTTLGYFLLLYFCTSNLTLLLVTVVYGLVIWRITGNFRQAALLSFAATVALVKGKSVSFFVLPKELVQTVIKRDLVYYVPLTISDLFLGVLLWLYLRKPAPVRLPAQNKSAVWALLSVLFFCVVSVVGSRFPTISLVMALQMFRLCLVFLLAWFAVRTAEDRRLLYHVLAALVLFQGVWGIAQFINGGYLGRYIESFNQLYTYGKAAAENPNLLRVSGTFVDPDLYGTFMFMHSLFFLMLVLLHRYRTNSEKHIYMASSLVSGTTLFLSGNRVIYFLFVVGLFFILWNFRTVVGLPSLRKRKWWVAVVLLLVILLWPYVSARMQNILSAFSPTGSGTFRIQMADYSLRLGKNSLLGVGLGMSPYFFATAFPQANLIFGPDFPHNVFFQVFAETGIGGLVAFVTFVYLCLRRLFVSGLAVENSEFYLAALAYLLCACFYPLFIPLTELVTYFFLYLGIAWFQAEKT